MERSSRSALKEWASVEEALAEGRIALLIRKGGISERRGGFEVEHRGFWLFPTHYHQNVHELAEPFRPLVADAAPPSRDTVRIATYAEVTDALRVESLEALERVEGLHPLTQETVRSRFAYRGKPYLHALVLRVHRLPEPRVVPNTLDYEGCISWVELDDAVATDGARPAMADDDFERFRGEVLRRLGSEGVTRL